MTKERKNKKGLEAVLLKKLIKVMLIISAALEILALIFLSKRLEATIGIVTGTALEVFNIWHINYCMDEILISPEHKAKSRYFAGYMLRLFVAMLAFYVMLRIDMVSFFAVFVASQGIKIASYYVGMVDARSEDNSIDKNDYLGGE